MALTQVFFQSYWDILGESLVSYCNEFLESGKLPKGLNTTHIVLIPKKQNPEYMTDLRPIALFFMAYKILSKALANRLKSLLAKQSAFVPGRLITDNIVIDYVMQHFLKRKTQGKEGYASLKLDMSKAYDRLEWPLLQDIMIKLGFAEHWVSLIVECVTSVEYFVLNKGDEIGPIKPGRGIRQGDPISPYLFIIVA